jgi:hypothetical protein
MTRWRWDVDPKEPLAALRVPVTSRWPEHGYFATFDKGSPRRPTSSEVMMILGYIEYYRQRHYTPTEQLLLKGQPFDVDPSVETLILHKYAEGDWGYRRRHWQSELHFVPRSPKVVGRSVGPLSLQQVLDLAEAPPSRPDRHWVAWKKQHPQVFAS